MKKRILSLILVIMMLLSFNISTVQASTFPDVPDTHWADYYIYATHYLDIINGYEDGTFRPDNKVKTGEFIKMASMALWPKYKYKEPKEGDHWSVPYLYTLNRSVLDVDDYNNEILEREITRAEAAQIVSMVYIRRNPETNIDTTEKYIKNYADEASITDAKTRRAINICTQFGIINGFEDGTFRGDETLTRAQATKLIYTTIYN